MTTRDFSFGSSGHGPGAAPVAATLRDPTSEELGHVAAQAFKFPRPGGIEVALAHVEAAMIADAMTRSEGIKRKAAVLLGISRYALERRIRRIAETLAVPPPPRPTT